LSVFRESKFVWDGFCYPLCSAKAKDDCERKSQSKGNPQAGDQKGIGLDYGKEETPY
jgi:hypothetical protein